MIMKMIPRMIIIIFLMMIKVGSIQTTKGRMSEQRRGKNTGEDEDKVDSMMVFMIMMMMMMMMKMMKMLNAAANDDDAQGYD